MPETLCPFRMQAVMLNDVQKARIHLAGKPENSRLVLNADCIGPDCMAFLATGKHPQTGKPVGACGLAAGPAHVVSLGLKINALNERLDTLTFAFVEAAEGMRDKGGSLADHFAARMRKFIADPVDDAPAAVAHEKPKLVPSPEAQT